MKRVCAPCSPVREREIKRERGRERERKREGGREREREKEGGRERGRKRERELRALNISLSVSQSVSMRDYYIYEW